jgi:hypothetical protein
MKLKVLATSVALVATVIGSAAQADPPNFDFFGYSNVPTTVGGTLTLRSVLTNNGVVPTPITLDFTTNQYTLVVTGTLASVVGLKGFYSPATCSIYEDPIGGGTAADYASAATFTDGTLILGGAFDGNLERLRFTTNLGSFIGKVDFTSGSRLGDLLTPHDWPFGGGWSRSVSGIPAGYHENWDGKIDLAAVAVEDRAWGAVKELFK